MNSPPFSETPRWNYSKADENVQANNKGDNPENLSGNCPARKRMGFM